MKRTIATCSVLLLASAMTLSAAETTTTNLVEELLSVPRCQAIQKNGKQCVAPASEGCAYCWKHKIASVAKEANEDVKGAWKATKSWSTNVWQATKDEASDAWQATKDGANAAWQGTKGAANSTRVGIVELFGGVDAETPSAPPAMTPPRGDR